MKLAFFFTFTDNDYLLAQRLVEQINTFYPEALILAIGDGADPKHRLNCVCWFRKSLKKLNTIGSFTQENFSFILDMLVSDPTIDSVIKLDPDSFLKRAFNSFPNGKWGGETKRGDFTWGYSHWCRGGGYFIKKETIEEIVSSQLLLNPQYNVLQKVELKNNKIYEDCRLGHVANRLNIYPVEWNEVNCGRFSKLDKRSRKKALFHPVKQILYSPTESPE
jgi:hypothetical protein